ncbi:recombinase family protein [Roseomonas sp. SG15]|uniref:Recombinase family protein n=1 Tax=Roseomonas indoligenes TaxID=2820811 RepID=A0A940N429_9PROT|nr:recombinase family protein [Pararoseomonas indoligenes]
MAGSRFLSRTFTQPRYAVGLHRVSTAEQDHSGLGLEAQQASVRAFVEREGWTPVAEHQDIASGKDDRRPGFQAALPRCRQLGAVLVAARLDRITRRAHTLSQLLEGGISIRAADMPGADDLMMGSTRPWRRRSGSSSRNRPGRHWPRYGPVEWAWAGIGGGGRHRRPVLPLRPSCARRRRPGRRIGWRWRRSGGRASPPMRS